MSEYSTIKQLVIETCMHEGTFPSYEKLTSLVLKHFPNSKWQKTHYAWYKSKIKTGDIPVPGLASISSINNQEDTDIELQETIDASISLERDLHSYFLSHINEIEDGLNLVANGFEYQTDAGRIDLLAKDNKGNNVIIELKAGKATDNALGQLLGYMGYIASDSKENVQTRGILIAFDFDSRVIYAIKALPQVKLMKYRVSFMLEEIK